MNHPTSSFVSEYLVQLIAKQVDDKGLVVWYDPWQAYGSVAAEQSLPNTVVDRYDGSFFKLRKEIDHLLDNAGGGHDGGQRVSRRVSCRWTSDETTHPAGFVQAHLADLGEVFPQTLARPLHP